MARKKQYYENIKDGVWCYFIPKTNNPCGCGSNCFHYEYDGETVIGVCNACKTDIYEVKEEAKKELLEIGIWK